MLTTMKMQGLFWMDNGINSKPYPQGFLNAFSYRAVGEYNRFTVVSDSDESVIEQLAHDYAKKHWGQLATEPIQLDQSKVGFKFHDHGKIWVVIAPYQYQKNYWIAVNTEDRGHRCYYPTSDLVTKQFCG